MAQSGNGDIGLWPVFVLRPVLNRDKSRSSFPGVVRKSSSFLSFMLLKCNAVGLDAVLGVVLVLPLPDLVKAAAVGSCCAI